MKESKEIELTAEQGKWIDENENRKVNTKWRKDFDSGAASIYWYSYSTHEHFKTALIENTKKGIYLEDLLLIGPDSRELDL